MDRYVNEALIELMQLCTMCSGHRFSQDSYSAPGFLDYFNRPLTIDDIPMESYNYENGADISKDPTSVPWEDSIKNFILDLSSVSSNEKFSTCILLTELSYMYSLPTISLLAKKYGKENTILVHATPVNDDVDTFILNIRRNDKIEYSNRVQKKYLVSDIFTWYVPDSTLILCHNTSIAQYRNAIEMMPSATWSISCNVTSYIESTNSKNKCIYLCPVYGCPGSTETRAVGSGLVKFSGYKVVPKYGGKMNYYFRCIRGSKHSSGRCYDCQVLYKLLVSLDMYRESSTDSPITSFEPNFLLSISDKNNEM